jgi:hypothetical protein
MTLPHQCNDYDGHEIMRFIMVISASSVERIILLFFNVLGLLAFVFLAMRVINFIRVIRVVRVIAVIFFVGQVEFELLVL